MSIPSSNSEFSWEAHPARERKGSTVFAAGVIVAAGAAAWISFGWAWAALSAVVLIAALNRFFFPSRFAIDQEGITARYPLRRQRYRWCDLRRFVHDQHGGFLSSRARRSMLDAYSGMHVLFGPNRQDVIERIRARLATASQGART